MVQRTIRRPLTFGGFLIASFFLVHPVNRCCDDRCPVTEAHLFQLYELPILGFCDADAGNFFHINRADLKFCRSQC